MTESSKDTAIACAVALLTYYNFDLGGYTAQQRIAEWLNDYQATWICWAAIEALYQGRYKGVSVGQILACWKRRNQPLYHFNYEFERLVCRNFPNNISAESNSDNQNTFVADVAVEGDRSEIRPNQTAIGDDLIEEVLQSAVVADTHSTLESSARAVAEELLSQISEPSDSDLSNPTTTAPDPVETTFIEFVNSTRPLQLKRRAAETTEQAQIKPEVKPESTESQQSEIRPDQIPRKVPQTKYQADWARWEGSKQPINRFNPAKESSDFYAKLKAVAASPAEDSALDAIANDIDLEKDFWSDD